jgi:predicted Zn-dependent protease
VTRGTAGRTEIHGLSAVVGSFGVTSDNQALTGEAAFFAHGGNVFQFVGFAPSASWSARKAVVQKALRSFRPLTDAKALAVKPYTIEVETIDRAQTLAEFQQRRPSSIPLERLAVLNHVEPSTRIPPGTLVKRVLGGRDPG